MRCNCCGRKKKLFESFEKMKSGMNLCVQCSTLLYKYRDAKNEGNETETKKLANEIKKKSEKYADEIFFKWFDNL